MKFGNDSVANLKRIACILPALLILSGCGMEGSASSASSRAEVQSACDYIINALNQDQTTIDQQDRDTAELNSRLAKEDPAYADAFTDTPSLHFGILDGDNWDQHALRMIEMYETASKLVIIDSDFSALLKDSALVWAKRLNLRQTPAGPLKGDLSEEQIALDTREGKVNRPRIKQICNIPGQLLP